MRHASRRDLEPCQTGGYEHSPGRSARGQHVQLAQLDWLGRLHGHAKHLSDTGRKCPDRRVPRQVAESSTEQEETGRGVDDAEQRRHQEPRWHDGQETRDDGRHGRKRSGAPAKRQRTRVNAPASTA